MEQPQDIVIESYGRERRYKWDALDSRKSDYNSTWGLRGPSGTTYLLMPDSIYEGWTHRMIAVGQFSGLYNIETGAGHNSIANDIESLLKSAINRDIDRKIKKDVYESWKVA